jgi:hypothetical protein
LYLDWLAGRPAGDADLARVHVAIVVAGSEADRRLAARKDFVPAGHDKRAVVYVRRRAAGT